MCLTENELGPLIAFFAIQLARLCLVFATRDGLLHLRFASGSASLPLFRALFFTIPIAALIKLFHDWVGLSGRTVCMDRLVFLLGVFLLCAASEFESFFSKQVEESAGVDLQDKHPLRLWGLYLLLGAAWIGLSRLIPFR